MALAQEIEWRGQFLRRGRRLKKEKGRGNLQEEGGGLLTGRDRGSRSSVEGLIERKDLGGLGRRREYSQYLQEISFGKNSSRKRPERNNMQKGRKNHQL